MADITISSSTNSYSYDSEAPLRAGGKMNLVFRGIHVESGESVLIKALHERWNEETDKVKQFYREMDLHVEHPEALMAQDIFAHDGNHFAVRPWLAGTPADQLKRSQRKLDAVLTWAMDILAVLEHVHQQGLLHGDLRPGNVLIRESDGKACLIDWGQAIQLDDLKSLRKRQAAGLIYAAPEQLLFNRALFGPSTDLYGLAVTIYELLSGNPPVQDGHPIKLMHLQLTQPLQPHRSIPQPVFDVLVKASAKPAFPKPPQKMPKAAVIEALREAVGKRYADVAAFRVALEEAREQANTVKPKRNWIRQLVGKSE